MSMWREGMIEIKSRIGKMVSISFLLKQFDKPTRFGINDGRILILLLKQDWNPLFIYDWGEELKPQTPEAEKALAILIAKYN